MNLIAVSLLILLFPLSALSAADKCPEGQYWVEGHSRRAYIRADGQSVSSTTVKSHCKSYSQIHERWNPRFIDKAPAQWPHKIEKFKRWTAEERERALEALGELPENLLSNNVKGVYRATRSHQHPNPATSADGIIVLYDTVFEPKVNLSRVIGHEFSHQIYKDLSKTQKSDYGFTTNWFSIGATDQFISRKDGFVQDDGRESPEEDFANNVEYYLFAPEELKKITPHAYRWIENHFGAKFKLRGGSK